MGSPRKDFVAERYRKSTFSTIRSLMILAFFCFLDVDLIVEGKVKLLSVCLTL